MVSLLRNKNYQDSNFMKFSAPKARLAMLLASTFFLASCGGGGGGDSAGTTNSTTPGTSDTVTTSPASTITSANSQTVVAYAIATSEGMNRQSALSSGLLTGVSVETSHPGLLDLTLQQAYKAFKARRGANLVAGVTTVTTDQCIGGGTITATETMAVADRPTNGDRVIIKFASCSESGMVLNGNIGLDFSNLIGNMDVAPWSATLAVTYTDFSNTAGTASGLANGSMVLDFSQTSSANATAAIKGAAMQIKTTMKIADATTVIDAKLTDFSFTIKIDPGYLAYSTDYGLSGNFPKLGAASYVIKASTEFKQAAGSNPTQGALTVTATDKTSARLTVGDLGRVKVELDKNGDGTIDETVNTTWSALKAQI
jgi:hypothetical protein